MSMIPASDPAAADPTAATATTPTDPTGPAVDPAVLALVDQLRPILNDMLTAAITEAQASAAKVTIGSGTVLTVTVDNGTTTGSTCSVKMDGDDAGGEITASVISARPSPPDRVMVMFVPPSSAFIIGILGGTDVPAATLSAYIGKIDSPTGGSGLKAPPRGYVLAYGQVLEQLAAPWLYNEVGTTLNTGGEASTQFRNIDMRGRIPQGIDNMGGSDAGISSLANTIGTAGGAETHTIGQGNLPSVNFTVTGTVSVTGVSGTVGVTLSDPGHSHLNEWSGGYHAVSGTDYPAAGSDAGGTSSNGTGISVSGTSFTFTGGSGSLSSASAASGGSGTAVNHMPPTRVVHWLVKL